MFHDVTMCTTNVDSIRHESKKSTLKTKMDEVASKAIHYLRIGDLSLRSDVAITECIGLGFCTRSTTSSGSSPTRSDSHRR